MYGAKRLYCATTTVTFTAAKTHVELSNAESDASISKQPSSAEQQQHTFKHVGFISRYFECNYVFVVRQTLDGFSLHCIETIFASKFSTAMKLIVQKQTTTAII
jgi:hypothetical protein